ncbi:MAG: bifunctional phosphoribosylaminoimidazolecarboxamide formyltransferase/IMP cyclohydrolase [Chloroflexi bacterium]|nr:bifunctional phosphoribosylaminoimidazolecarboxamide formyltransferase/IMP cyclohydrolase [Chloroflexota bacterium]
MAAPEISAARIVVGVSGQGSNLRALVAAERRGILGGRIVSVFADRVCPATDWAVEQGIPVLLVPPSGHPDLRSWDIGLAAGLQQIEPDVVVLAGFLRILGPEVLNAFRECIINVHPSLLPAFPGLHAIRDALDARVVVTGVTVHLVDETLDGGPIVAQEAVPILPSDDEASLAARIHAVEHRLLPRVVAMAAAGTLGIDIDGRLTFDRTRSRHIPVPRRALLSMSDKDGLVDLARALDGLGFELVSTGGTARTMRDAGLPVTDVAAVTGSPEMLDGRVKTLHPRIHGGVLADLRSPAHRGQLAHANIDAFQVVAVNLYRFADAAARPGIDLDALIEEIDIGGPALVRAAAKNHANVAILTDPRQYPGVLDELRRDGAVSETTRRDLALAAYRLTADYDTMIAAELGRRFAGDGEGAEPGVEERLPARLEVSLERAALLRYGENPHQAAALYVVPGADPMAGALATGARPLQGKPLSYNNLLDAAAAAGLARDLRGAAIAIIKHGNPCGTAEAPDLTSAWEGALSGDPVSAFGGVVAVKGVVDRALAERLASLFLEVVVACAFDTDARAILAAKQDLRLLEDPGIVGLPVAGVELRSAGGAVLATDADVSLDQPATWRSVGARPPSEQELTDLDLAWRVSRHVRSNAIVLARDGVIVGVGAGQMSRVDSARLAVDKAGLERARGAVCASDAFFPFPDALEVCATAGVTAFVHPGGSKRDAEVIAAADAAGAAILLTGVRHFRH